MLVHISEEIKYLPLVLEFDSKTYLEDFASATFLKTRGGF